MRFDIARSLNGDKLVYIARDTNGIVRLRATSEAELIEMIKNYDPVPSSKPIKAEGGTVHKDDVVSPETEEDNSQAETPATVQLESVFVVDSENPEEGAKEIAQRLVTKPKEETAETSSKTLVENELASKVEDKKKKTGGSSFWDKLK